MDKLIISNASTYGKNKKKTDAKFFVESTDNKKISSLCINVPQMNGYGFSYKETKFISFAIKNNQ